LCGLLGRADAGSDDGDGDSAGGASFPDRFSAEYAPAAHGDGELEEGAAAGVSGCEAGGGCGVAVAGLGGSPVETRLFRTSVAEGPGWSTRLGCAVRRLAEQETETGAFKRNNRFAATFSRCSRRVAANGTRVGCSTQSQQRSAATVFPKNGPSYFHPALGHVASKSGRFGSGKPSKFACQFSHDYEGETREMLARGRHMQCIVPVRFSGTIASTDENAEES